MSLSLAALRSCPAMTAMMRRILLALTLLSSTLLAQEPRVLSIADFGTPTYAWLPAPAVSGTGDFPFGSGLAIRHMPDSGWHAGHWHVYTSSWPDTIMMEFELPASFSGAATFIQKIGDFPHYGMLGGDSMFFDDDSGRLCISSGSQYTYSDGISTLTCARIDAITGKIQTVTSDTGVTAIVRNAWKFQVCTPSGTCTNRPNRMTQSGILRIRNEEIAAKLKGHYVAGFGGTYSVISNGVSMGLSGCSFDLPSQEYVGPITCTPILGYPVNSRGGEDYMNRDPDYKQVLEWDTNPQKGTDALKKYGTGKFAPEDGFYGMAADIVDVNGAQAFVGFGEMQRGCIAYGDNQYNLPPTIQEPGKATPTATNLSTGELTIPIAWESGQMVRIAGPSSVLNQIGLVGEPYKYYSYFIRKVADSTYTLHRNLDMALGAEGIVPVSTDVANNIVKFARPHGIVTQSMVTVVGDSGGLIAGDYYVNASRPNELSFHLLYEDSAGYPFTAAKNHIDLTGPVTSMIVPRPIVFRAALVYPLQEMSYCQSPSSPTPYPKATVQSQGARHVLYFYDINDLASVASGAVAQNKIQPKSYSNLEPPMGITYPVPGMANRQITGVQWIPERSVYATSVRESSNRSTGRKIWFYPVIGGPATSKPSRAIMTRVVQ